MTVTGTYRLQLHEGFGFADAQAQLPYLAAPRGVPPLPLAGAAGRARLACTGTTCWTTPGSRSELGGEEGLRALAAAAREHGLGLVVDVVPNHMALVAPESRQRPALGGAARRAATPPTRTGSTSTGRPATAGSACPCSGARSPRRWRPGDLRPRRAATASR